MRARVYSHRFHNHSVGNQTWVWTVPEEHVAVAKFASVTNYEAGSAQAGVYLNGVPLWFVQFLDISTRLTDLRGVAYAGDTIQLYLSRANMMGHVSGYLFEGDASSLATQLPSTSHPGPPEPAAAADG